MNFISTQREFERFYMNEAAVTLLPLQADETSDNPERYSSQHGDKCIARVWSRKNSKPGPRCKSKACDNNLCKIHLHMWANFENVKNQISGYDCPVNPLHYFIHNNGVKYPKCRLGYYCDPEPTHEIVAGEKNSRGRPTGSITKLCK